MEMKKVLIIIFSLFLFITNIKAYENEIFKINISEDYKLEEQEKENNYKWIKDNKYISISVSDNSELKYNITKFTDEDLQKQKEYLEGSINENLSKYNITSEVKEIKLSEDKTTLTYDIYYPSKDTIGYDIYQRGKMYTTTHYILTIIYNSDEEIKDDNQEYINLINSLTILDDPIKEPNPMIKYYLLGGIVIVVLSFAILLIIKKKHK